MSTRAAGRVAWIAWAPVKGLALALLDETDLTPRGIAGDRSFYLVDGDGRLVNAKRAGALLQARAALEGERLSIAFPDGSRAEGDVELGEEVETSFYGRPVRGRLVRGPWAKPLSALAGIELSLVRVADPGEGLDRGREAGASLVSTGSLRALGAALGGVEVDGRRFRMTLGIDGVGAHAEDGWIGRRVELGEAAVVPRGNVGRCRITTLDPDSGERDLQTLDAIDEYRAGVETTEPLPFGVWCEVVEQGRVRVGDAVAVARDAPVAPASAPY